MCSAQCILLIDPPNPHPGHVGVPPILDILQHIWLVICSESCRTIDWSPSRDQWPRAGSIRTWQTNQLLWHQCQFGCTAVNVHQRNKDVSELLVKKTVQLDDWLPATTLVSLFRGRQVSTKCHNCCITWTNWANVALSLHPVTDPSRSWPCWVWLMTSLIRSDNIQTPRKTWYRCRKNKPWLKWWEWYRLAAGMFLGQIKPFTSESWYGGGLG